MNDTLQKQTNLRDELARTQHSTIDHILNRLIEHRADIMDVLTLDDFSSKALITTSRSESEILRLTPQVKEFVIEQRTLEAGYRQLLLDYEAGLTDLINKFSDLKERIKSEYTSDSHLQKENKVNNTSQKQNEQYWAAFFDELPSDKLGLKTPSVYDSHYRDFHMGIKGCYIRASQRVTPQTIHAAFVMKGSAQDYLHSLKEQQVVIEKELGEKLYWYEGIKGETQGQIKLKYCDVTDETDWSDQHQWFVRKFEKLVEVFRPRIERQN
ncbi:DUF4268 domain-containing protein [Candidatus Poribacteria bacterium]|nr:DUF4268 domain-containing protein [Candidatus Poribacteria bacterium]